MRELLHDLRRLVERWWQVDRIRVSPQEGRLLRLKPPCFLIIDGRPVEVTARTLGRGDPGTLVSYDCRTCDGVGRLTVRSIGGSTSEVVWTASGVERRLATCEVEVFAPSRSLARGSTAR